MLFGFEQIALYTPFENAQRWMGKNTLHFLLLNDDNMIGEDQETRIEMPNMCPFEKKEKEVFFQTNNFFFQEQKNFVQGTTFVQFFMYWEAKKNFGAIRNFLKFLFSKIVR